MSFSKKAMAQVVADLIEDGQSVNLGIGMPTMVADFLEHRPVMIHSENGLLGMGPYPRAHQVDPQIINAGKETVTIKAGGSAFDSSLSFAMIRGHHIDVAVLGAMQVAVNGDLANWQVPGQKISGMGGAMDLALGAQKLIIMMQHYDKNSSAKLVKECSLPLTAPSCVDIVVSDLGVFYINKSRACFEIQRLAPGVSLLELGDKNLFCAKLIKE